MRACSSAVVGVSGSRVGARGARWPRRPQLSLTRLTPPCLALRLACLRRSSCKALERTSVWTLHGLQHTGTGCLSAPDLRRFRPICLSSGACKCNRLRLWPACSGGTVRIECIVSCRSLRHYLVDHYLSTSARKQRRMRQLGQRSTRLLCSSWLLDPALEIRRLQQLLRKSGLSACVLRRGAQGVQEQHRAIGQLLWRLLCDRSHERLQPTLLQRIHHLYIRGLCLL